VRTADDIERDGYTDRIRGEEAEQIVDAGHRRSVEGDDQIVLQHATAFGGAAGGHVRDGHRAGYLEPVKADASAMPCRDR
jgi:hypothetical protein